MANQLNLSLALLTSELVVGDRTIEQIVKYQLHFYIRGCLWQRQPWICILSFDDVGLEAVDIQTAIYRLFFIEWFCSDSVGHCYLEGIWVWLHSYFDLWLLIDLDRMHTRVGCLQNNWLFVLSNVKWHFFRHTEGVVWSRQSRCTSPVNVYDVSVDAMHPHSHYSTLLVSLELDHFSTLFL